jgi:hypothetical protein
MEKTLSYAINEAIETGYRAGRLGNSFDEVGLRERIAQEIERYKDKFIDEAKTDEFYKGVCNGMFFAASIARGVPID